MKSVYKEIISRQMGRILIVGLLLALWQFVSIRGLVDKSLIGTPSHFLGLALQWLHSGYILPHIWVTLEEVALGLLIGTSLGILFGLWFALSPFWGEVFEPVMVFLNAMPRVILAPLFVLWFGLGAASKVVLVISLVFFVVFHNIYTGIREVNPDLIHNAKILGANRWKLFQHIYLPAALGWIFSSLRISVGMAVVGAVIGEYMGSMKGLGNVIVNAQAFYQIDQIFAALMLILVIVILIDGVLQRFERHFSFWRL